MAAFWLIPYLQWEELDELGTKEEETGEETQEKLDEKDTDRDTKDQSDSSTRSEASESDWQISIATTYP